MRKLSLKICALIILILLITSCVPDIAEPPEGVWVSENPRIILYFKPEYSLPTSTPSFIGMYEINSVETKVFVDLDSGLAFGLFLADGLNERGRPTRGRYLLFGTYRVINDEIHWRLSPHFQDQLGIETIIFTRLETYDPVDPYYWFPHLFPRD